jgi:ribonuclease BN (tRNA processing enzyme)
MSFRFTCLGCSAAKASLTSSPSSYFLDADGVGILFDCSDGTHQRALRASLPLRSLGLVFISHLHVDHVGGLVPFLSALAFDRTAPLHVVGPVGIRELVETSLRLTRGLVPYPLIFTELQGAASFWPFHQARPQGKVLASKPLRRERPGAGVQCPPRLLGGLGLSFHPLRHTVLSFACLIEEPDRVELDPVKLKAAELPFGSLWHQLKARGSVIHPNFPHGDPLLLSDYSVRTPGRKVLFCGDCCGLDGTPAGAMNDAQAVADWIGSNPDELFDAHAEPLHPSLCCPSYLPELARGADLVIREATFSASHPVKASDHPLLPRHGHSTAADTGLFAFNLGARRLLCTHYSLRYRMSTKAPVGRPLRVPSTAGGNSVAGLLLEAARAAGPDVEVVGAQDGAVVEIPLARAS